MNPEEEKEKEREQGLISRLRIESPERERGNGMFLTSLCFLERCFDDFLDMLHEQQQHCTHRLPRISPHISVSCILRKLYVNFFYSSLSSDEKRSFLYIIKMYKIEISIFKKMFKK